MVIKIARVSQGPEGPLNRKHRWASGKTKKACADEHTLFQKLYLAYYAAAATGICSSAAPSAYTLMNLPF